MMEESSNIIDNFESLLKKQTLKRPIGLYNSSNSEISSSKPTQTSYSAKDILANVSKQLKAIQNADTANYRQVHQARNKLEKYKTGEFLTVGMLPVTKEVQEKASKFETQCVSDTQLINIIENAELVDKHRGVTQEFDTSFCQKTDNFDNDNEKPPNISTDDVDGKLNIVETNATIQVDKDEIYDRNNITSEMDTLTCQSIVIADCGGVDHTMMKQNENESQNNECVAIDNKYSGEDFAYPNDKSVSIEDKALDLDENKPLSPILDECCAQYVTINKPPDLHKDTASENDKFATQSDETEVKHPDLEENRSISPILNSVRKTDTPPMVFSLYAFEKFENLAHPIIEEYADLQTAKSLINSQIIDKELFLPNQCDRQSPILSKEEFVVAKDISNFKDSGEIKEQTPNSPEMFDSFEFDDLDKKEAKVIKPDFEDELVFSSDEGDNYAHKEARDLPLTCALETSFYDQSDILDKTMYVGFQTASNKSIQISKDSFNVAKSILSDIEDNETSLKDLVELFDSGRERTNLNSDNLRDRKDYMITENEYVIKIDLNCDKVEPEGSIKDGEKIDDTFKNLSLTALEENSVTNEDIAMSQVIQFKSIPSLKSREINMSSNDVLEAANKVDAKRKLEGFKTASNKRIKLSDKALAECKKVFQDIQIDDIIEDIDCKNNPHEKDLSTQIECEKTLNTSQVVIKENEKCKTQDVRISQIDQDILLEFENSEPFKEELITDNTVTEPLNIEEPSTSNDNSKLPKIDHTTHNEDDEVFKKPELILKTASNKRSKISNEAVITTKKFHDTELNHPQNKIDFDSDQPSTSKFVGFRTAANKDIKVSKEALEKTKNFYKDVDIPFNANEDEEKDYNDKLDGFDDTEDIFAEELALTEDIFKENITENKNIFKGFQTTSNKAILISEKALTESKKLFGDIITNHEPSSESQSNAVQNIQDKDANNAKYAPENKICKDNLIKDTSIIINMLDTASEETKFNTELEKLDNVQAEIPMFKGFQTASNKQVKISDKALEKCKKVFKDLDLSQLQEDQSEFNVKSNKNNDLMDFQRAKCGRMSNDFELDIDDKENFDRISHGPQPSTSKFVGFTTASNKRVKISDKALANSKEILKDLELIDTFNKAYKTDKDFSSHNFVGFHTASNKEIKISSEALAKTKRIFESINDCEKGNISEKIIEIEEKTSPIFKGFQTASNKKVEVSEKALLRSKRLFEDIEMSQSKVSDDVNLLNDFGLKSVSIMNDFNKPSTNSFVGFTTASNKKVKISADALAKSKQLLKEFELGDICNEANSENENVGKFVGFHTASNKEITVSKEALTRSKEMLEEISNYDRKSDITEKIAISEDPANAVFSGFRTASNKRVEISGNALARSKRLFEDINTSDSDHTAGKTEGNAVFEGFQTASNKKVQISETALAMSKRIFGDIDMLESDNAVTEIEENFTFRGFKSASNKKVQISEEALAKSKRIFGEIGMCEDDPAAGNVEEKNAFPEFQTASNKEVQVSEAALLKSKKLFENLDTCESDKAIRETSVFQGFKTASNKKVRISEEALAKSKRLFGDIDMCESDNTIEDTEEKNAFQGFKTASNKTVKVSENALAKSKKIFKDIEQSVNDNDNDLVHKENNAVFQGFQTASNKKVKISEKALAKSKKLFEDLDLSQVNNVNELEDSNIKKAKCISEKSHNSKAKGSTVQNIAYFEGYGVKGSEEALTKSKPMSKHANNENEIIEPKCSAKTPIIKSHHVNLKTDNVATNPNLNNTNIINNMLDTQVLHDFQESLNTEDFCNSTPKSKRSGSPILSCPRAKKRKFETPYKNDNTKKTEPVNNFQPPKLAQTYKFEENYKKNKIFTIQDLSKLESGAKSKTDAYITKFTFDKLLNFEFFDSRNDYNEVKMDIEQLKKLFLDSVNKKIVPDGWLDNHIRLILWKLISYEVKFPNIMKNICTVRNVMNQLKYRYDRELYNVERPVLRKILEKDEVASKTMVLLVVGIYVDDISVTSAPTANQNIELLVTDGWYTIKATTDRMITKLVCDGRILVGTKIATSGAELLNCEQGIAPWEDTSSVRLKLTGNSTRRALRQAKLGARNTLVRCSLGSIDPAGGKAAITALVTRVYPPIYVEKMTDGSTVTLSERLEHVRQMKHESETQTLVEKLYEELEKELIDQDSQDSEICTVDRITLDSGSQISKQMRRSRDPEEYRTHLTKSQCALLEEHNAKRREKQIEALRVKFQEKLERNGLNTQRNVIPLLKVRIAGFDEREGAVKINRGFLSIWKPSAAVVEVVKEGAWIEILNVLPTGNRNSEIQLSAGRQAIFKPFQQRNEKYKLYTDTLKRKCYQIKELSQNPLMTTEYNEIDTVGIVFQVEPRTDEFDNKKQTFQNVYLADAEKNIICVNFWGGLKKFGFENLLDTGQIITCVNLQKRAGNTRKSIPHFRVTEFTYFTKTPKDKSAATLTGELSNQLSKIKDKFCGDCRVMRENLSLFKTRDVDISPYRFGSISKNRIDTPISCDANLNLTGLDFESTFRTDSQMSPAALLRKKRVNEKIEKLQFLYGEPPPLSSVRILNQSKNASACYKSPLIPKSDVASGENAPSVTSVEKEMPNVASPVSLNKTFVKKVNPVKIDFSKEEDDLNGTVDHFAEEFDASPPLSLDSDLF